MTKCKEFQAMLDNLVYVENYLISVNYAPGCTSNVTEVMQGLAFFS